MRYNQVEQVVIVDRLDENDPLRIIFNRRGRYVTIGECRYRRSYRVTLERVRMLTRILGNPELVTCCRKGDGVVTSRQCVWGRSYHD